MMQKKHRAQQISQVSQKACCVEPASLGLPSLRGGSPQAQGAGLRSREQDQATGAGGEQPRRAAEQDLKQPEARLRQPEPSHSNLQPELRFAGLRHKLDRQWQAEQATASAGQSRDHDDGGRGARLSFDFNLLTE
jgi:hypothetical protein